MGRVGGPVPVVSAGAAGEECTGARPPVCAVWWCLSSVPAFPGQARPVATAALALWSQSWAIHSITKRRPRVPGDGSFCIPIALRSLPIADKSLVAAGGARHHGPRSAG